MMPTSARAVILSVVCALLLCASSPASADLVVATWNISGGDRSPAELRARVAALEAEIGEIDLLLVQEVVSEEQVEAIAAGLGIDHWAMSDFSPPIRITEAWWKSLEVAVISRLPIEAAAEWDATGPGPAGDGYAPRTSSAAILTEELPLGLNFQGDNPSRGFLRVDLQGSWSVFAVHWKSSRGEACNAADMANARQRENQAAGLVLNARDALAAGRTVIVGGDLNIQAPGRALRVGTDPGEDCMPRGACDAVCGPDAADGYDDSIQMLLEAGDGVRLLSAELPKTYVVRFFPGGAIDHLVVAGPRANDFTGAWTPEAEGTSYLGSDHRPVVAKMPEQ